MDNGRNEYQCDYCGCGLDEDEYYYTGDGHYGCESCVSQAVDNDEYYQTSDLYYCESDGNYYRSDDDLVYIGHSYYHVDECYRSECLDEWIHQDDAVKVMLDGTKTDYVTSEYALYSKYYGAYILKENATTNIKLNDVFFTDDTELMQELEQQQNAEKEKENAENSATVDALTNDILNAMIDGDSDKAILIADELTKQETTTEILNGIANQRQQQNEELI